MPEILENRVVALVGTRLIHAPFPSRVKEPGIQAPNLAVSNLLRLSQPGEFAALGDLAPS